MSKFELIIEPDKTIKNFWKELWQYRDLFYFLAWRDVLVRYKQTVIGIAWSVLRPLLTMIVFTIIFGKIAKLPSGDIPYPLLVFAAMIPWQFFSNTFSEASNSLINNTHLQQQ
jgi:lipopolysaccharide transport system permease protein